MPNVWEAAYQLDWRNADDASLSLARSAVAARIAALPLTAAERTEIARLQSTGIGISALIQQKLDTFLLPDSDPANTNLPEPKGGRTYVIKDYPIANPAVPPALPASPAATASAAVKAAYEVRRTAWQAAFIALHTWQILTEIDFDHDGLVNADEYSLGLNPQIADYSRTSSRDTDGDGFTDAQELAAGTDAKKATSKPVLALQIISGAGQSGTIFQTLGKPIHVQSIFKGPNGGFCPAPGTTIEITAPNNYTLLAPAAGFGNEPASPEDWRPKTLRFQADTQGYAKIAVKLPHAPQSLRLGMVAIKDGIKGTITTCDLAVKAFSATDSDGDGMLNLWETKNRLNPADPKDATDSPLHAAYHRDTPWSQLTKNAQSDLQIPRDAFGLLGQSGRTAGQTAILNLIDPDHDGLSNLDESKLGTNPRVADDASIDTDGDGFPDLIERLNASDKNVAASVPPFTIAVVSGAAQTIEGGRWSAPLVVRVRQLGQEVLTDVTFTSSRDGLFRHAIFGESVASLSVSTAYNPKETSVLFQAPLAVGDVIITARVPGGGTAQFTLHVTEPQTGGGGGPTPVKKTPTTDPNPTDFNLSWDAPERYAQYRYHVCGGPNGYSTGIGVWQDATIKPRTASVGYYGELDADGKVIDGSTATSLEETWAKTKYPPLDDPSSLAGSTVPYGELWVSTMGSHKGPWNNEAGEVVGSITTVTLDQTRVRLQSSKPLPQGYQASFLVIEETRDSYSRELKSTRVVRTVTFTIPPDGKMSEPIEFLPTSPELGTSVSQRLVPVKLYSDLNNDGTLDRADSGLAATPYTSGATYQPKANGIEYMFINDKLSNGAWDREDPDAPADIPDPSNPTGPPIPTGDDDAKRLIVDPGIKDGEAWFTHGGIAGISFYRDKGCTNEITELSGGKKMTIVSTDTAKSWPPVIYMRADGDKIKFTDENQLESDLRLMARGKESESPIEAVKMKLVIIKQLGSLDHHLAVVDYIKEQNTEMYHNVLHAKKGDVSFVAMLRSQTQLVGINARPSKSKGIGEVAVSPTWKDLTVIINATYNYGPPGTKIFDSEDFFEKHLGELFVSGKWDSSCSVKISVVDPTGIYKKHIGSSAKGVFTMGLGGDLPVGAWDGTGGLKNISYSGLRWTAVVDSVVPGTTEHLLFAASGDDDTMGEFSVYNAMACDDDGGWSWMECDGGASVAMAISRQPRPMKVLVAGERHSSWWVSTINPLSGSNLYWIKAYLGFRATKIRP